MAWVTENQYMIKMLEEILEIVREQNKTIEKQDREIDRLKNKVAFLGKKQGTTITKIQKSQVPGRLS
jgi:uncharacterized coiled-coil protein SlyX